jgi:hypothetical protein
MTKTYADLYFEATGDEVGWYQSRCHDLSHKIAQYISSLGLPYQFLWMRAAVLEDCLRPIVTPHIPYGMEWRFHVALIDDGMVHDPYIAMPPIPLDQYLGYLFPYDVVKIFRGHYSHAQLIEQAFDPVYAPAYPPKVSVSFDF